MCLTGLWTRESVWRGQGSIAHDEELDYTP